MTLYSDILRNHGIQTKGIIHYGEPPLSGGPFPTTQDGANFYAGLGFLEYPFQDQSDGYTAAINAVYGAMKNVGGGVMGGVTGWGYTTGIQFNCAAKYPDDQEYYLVAGALVPATSYGIRGIVQDSPNYLAEWVKQYQAMDAGLGLGKLLGISGWPASDHGANYAGAQGAIGGLNMRTLARYVNYPSSIGFYQGDVSSAGAHLKDGTPCLLWGLRGVNPNAFTGQVQVTVVGMGSSSTYSGGIIPTVGMANDITAYHRVGRLGSFIEYYVTAGDATIELTLLQMIQAKGQGAFSRTAVPIHYLQNIPLYANAPLVLMANGVNNVYGIMQSTGGATGAVPYFNWANSLDNGSNPGRSNFFEVAFASTVIDHWTNAVPYVSNMDFVDVDTDQSHIMLQDASTPFRHYSTIWKQIPIGGWFGNEQDDIRVLTIDHYSNVAATWSALGSICRQWAVDSFASLAGVNFPAFRVVLGIPKIAADIAALKAAVMGGTNLILYRGGPADITGGGTTAVPLTAAHPIFKPYAPVDLASVFTNGYGTINQLGAGKVLVLPQSYYGEGYSVNENSNGQGGSDALASLLAWVTNTAILWIAGFPSPAMWLPKAVQRTSWAAPKNSNGQGGYSGVGIHVLGSKFTGAKYPVKTILISNGTSTPKPVAFDLDAAFYGFPASGWSLKDVNTGQVISGSGAVVSINTTVPPQDIMAFVQQVNLIPTTVNVSARAH